MTTHNPNLVSRRDLAARLLAPPATGSCLTSDIPELNDLIGPITPDLYVLLAATGMGKTSVMASIARSLVTQGPGLIATPELTDLEWEQRLIAAQARVHFNRIMHPERLAGAERARIAQACADLSLSADTVHYLRITGPRIEQVAEAAGDIPGLKWIIVDSISSMAGPGLVYERMTSLANGLLSLTRDFRVPVLAPSQIGRTIATDRFRRSAIPQLSDGYGSGMIEFNAAVVVGLYWHQYYVASYGWSPRSAFPPATARLYLLKHRHAAVPIPNYAEVVFAGGCGIYGKHLLADPPSAAEAAAD